MHTTSSAVLHRDSFTVSYIMRVIVTAGILIATFFPGALTLAQELQIVDASPITVENPEVYRAYYAKLNGEPHVYTVNASEPFRLSAVLLAPYVQGAKTDISAAIVEAANPDTPVAVLDGTMQEWVPFVDTAGRDDYLAGPIFAAGLDKGNYEIRVWSSNNDSTYVLVLGEEESFSLSGLFNKYSVLPDIKSEFFGKPAYQAYVTPLLMWPIIIAAAIALVIAVVIIVLRRRRNLQSSTL